MAEWFQQTHENTATSRGQILPDTVRQESDAVIFETSDGTILRQRYRSDGDGGYERIGDPEKVEPAGESRDTGME